MGLYLYINHFKQVPIIVSITSLDCLIFNFLKNIIEIAYVKLLKKRMCPILHVRRFKHILVITNNIL